MNQPVFQPLLDHYEDFLAQHGSTCQGVGWPREADVQKRFQILTGVWSHEPAEISRSVLDLGCGYGALVSYLQDIPAHQSCEYWGIDASARMTAAAQRNYPLSRFEHRDIIANPLPDRCVDYVLMNGVLTAKWELPRPDMVHFAEALILSAFSTCRKGIAFNVMNHHVDWQRDDLFHWPFDDAAAFIRAKCSRHYSFRSDFGLYDYVVYIYRDSLPVPLRT